MEATEGAPTPLYLGSSGEMTIPTVQALAVSGDTLYAASSHGVDLFQREGTFWHWEGQELSRATITSLASLPNGNAVVASDRGLFVLHGVNEVIQIPVVP